MLKVLEVTKKNPTLSFLVGVGSAWAAYYLLYIVQHPTIACNKKKLRFLLTHCPAIRRKFWPTVWCYGGRLQTIIRSLLQSKPDTHYNKEFLSLPDGGHVALDWVDNDLPGDTPITLIMPGLTGTSTESYALHFVKQAVSLGYRAVVFNYRGNGGAELKTAQTYSATNTQDLEWVLGHIKDKYPQAPVIAAGISLGGLILTNHLAKTGSKSGLVAGMSISSAWDVFESVKTLEEPLNRFCFNRILTNNLIASVKRYAHHFQNKMDLDLVYQCQTIREFDDRFTSVQFGYPSFKEYYVDACIHEKVDKVQVPLLCLNAADDPFSPEYAIPLDKARQSQNVAIVVTKYGGHIGFLEGLLPRHTSYMDRVFAQYADAIFKHGHELKEESS